MKLPLLLFCMLSLTFTAQATPIGDVWRQVISDPYDRLPHARVTPASFLDWGVNRLMESAIRTINNEEDLLPTFKKLVHPNGICLLGTWSIDRDSAYTGYFRQNSQGLIIARASVAFSETERGSYRAFGLAGKIFPTLDLDDPRDLKTANFFTIDDLMGTREPYFTRTALTNAPTITPRLSAIGLAPLGILAGPAFLAADSNPLVRQLYPISELGESDPDQAVTPRWMRLSASAGTPLISDARGDDFRNEIQEQIRRYGELKIDIEVANNAGLFRGRDWQRIGQIRFTKAVASTSCDTRLHFHHARFRYSPRF